MGLAQQSTLGMVRLLKLSDKTVLKKKRLKVKNTCMSVFFFKRRLDQSLNAALHC